MVTIRKEFVKGIRTEKALENTDFQGFRAGPGEIRKFPAASRGERVSYEFMGISDNLEPFLVEPVYRLHYDFPAGLFLKIRYGGRVFLEPLGDGSAHIEVGLFLP